MKLNEQISETAISQVPWRFLKVPVVGDFDKAADINRNAVCCKGKRKTLAWSSLMGQHIFN